MPTGTVRMGFEGLPYVGTAGSTAATLLENSRDITYGVQANFGDTTVRGDGTNAPVETGKPTRRIVDIEIVMINDTSDTNVETMRAAANSLTPLAIRTKDWASGKGFDGDCYLSFSQPYPLDGEQVITFTCKPTRDAGRAPNPYT